MLKLAALVSVLGAILLTGCAASPQPAANSDFAALCQALGKSDGQISKAELLAAARDKEEAARIFDQCEKNQQGFLTIEEARRQNWAIRELLRLTPPPKVIPPQGGRK